MTHSHNPIYSMGCCPSSKALSGGSAKKLRNVRGKCRRGKHMHRAVWGGTNDLQNYVKNIAWKIFFVRNIAAVCRNTYVYNGFLYFVYDVVVLDLLRIFAILLLLQLFQVSIIIYCTNGPIRGDWEACAKER